MANMALGDNEPILSNNYFCCVIFETVKRRNRLWCKRIDSTQYIVRSHAMKYTSDLSAFQIFTLCFPLASNLAFSPFGRSIWCESSKNVLI